MPTNRSLAIWCNAKTQSNPVVLETHFNYWRIAGDEDFRRSNNGNARDFIEIGVLIENPAEVNNVCIFMPHEIELEDVHDCSKHFRNSDISQGIFNETLSSTNIATTPRVVLLSSANGVFCRVHQFISADNVIDPSELTFRNIAEGTLLTVTNQAIAEICRHGTTRDQIYLRLRIFLNDKAQQTYVRRVPIPDRLFQSGSEEIEYIDFRLNEARTLPHQIEAMMTASQYKSSTQIKLVAFLTAVPVQSQLAVSSAPSHKLRLLEHSLWSAYVPTGIPEGMVVYHWKKVASRVDDFSAFVKLQTRRSGRFTLAKYLIFAFLFGILGNLAASAIQAGVEWALRKETPSVVQSEKPIGGAGKPSDPVSPAGNPLEGSR